MPVLSLSKGRRFDIEPNLYREIVEALAGNEEHDFRLMEKINLARLKQLDGKLK